MVCREKIPSLRTTSGTPPGWKVLSGRKEGWCLGSSLGKSSSRDHPSGEGRGRSEFWVSELSSLSPVKLASRSPLSLLQSLGPRCHYCGRGSSGSTKSRPRPSLVPRHHPGSRRAGSGARLEGSVWKPTANASPKSHSTPACLFHPISYLCQRLSFQKVLKDAWCGARRSESKLDSESWSSPGISFLKATASCFLYVGILLILWFATVSPAPRTVARSWSSVIICWPNASP